MNMRSAIFFVAEAEYDKLQRLCPEDFPYTYAQFSKRVDDSIGQMPADIHAVKVYITVSDFSDWCIESRIKPDGTARAKFAMLSLAKEVNPNAHF